FLKKKALPLSLVYSQVAPDALKRLERAYQQFFHRVKADEKPGFPRFKGSGQYASFTYPHYISGVKLAGEHLHLSKIGDIPVRLHRPLQGTPKTCTITHKADGWYAGICCEVEPEPLPATGQDVGIDVGIENFATLTDEHEPIPNPRPLQNAQASLQNAQASLRKAQRRLERRTR